MAEDFANGQGRRHTKGKDAAPLERRPSSDPMSKDEEVADTVQLKREMGLIRAVAIIVSAMIGSGIFISPQGILRGANSVGMSLIIWIVCGGVSFLGALCYVELGTVLPRAGGTYQYILHAYGDLAGFVVSWAYVVILKPASAALVSITLGTYISDYVIPGDCAPPNEAIQLFAILSVTVMMFVNCVSVRYSSGGVVILTISKVVALLIIIAAGIVQLFKGRTQYLNPEVSFQGSTTQILGYGTALYYGFWAYSGWDYVNNLMEELKNPARDLPLSIAIAVPIVTAIYLLTNIAYFTVLSPNELLASSAVAVTFAERTLGIMAWLVPLGVCISTAGTLLGSFLSGPRTAFAAGREGHMLSILSMVSVKYHTPLPAILLQGLVAIVLILMGDFNSIIVYGSIVQWILFLAAFAAVFVLRRKYPDTPRPFKVNSLVPILAIIASIFMVLAPIISDPKLEYLYAFVLLALGLLVYIVFVRGKRQLPFMDQMTVFCQKLFLVGPSRA
ncbi:b(0,+)-type amino acid transporter 1-like isoform X1 [Patiria miniata]|uniref:b(0,+)-type amino acid transporter 1 n=1 Tax=Patiria miniata TaxID=46514 RepID=A0A914A6T8_PATMI|nr:b(0,+)-type amino acid transporter 1-like isoform X1 [Patiria miniata]